MPNFIPDPIWNEEAYKLFWRGRPESRHKEQEEEQDE